MDIEKIKLRNESNNEFVDISSEKERVYTFPGGEGVRISCPNWLSVSKSGGHRILDYDGICHYIPPGWIHLQWVPWDEAPHFVK